MAKRKYDYDQIYSLRASGMTQQEICALVGCTQHTVYRAERFMVGRPLPPSMLSNQEKIALKPNSKMCSCCGNRPVDNGNRFLCRDCFKYGEN